MGALKLNKTQIKRVGPYPAPDLNGYSSLFFNPLTRGETTNTYLNWGLELTMICEKESIQYYYFFNDFGTKINVYPNEVIKRWYNQKF